VLIIAADAADAAESGPQQSHVQASAGTPNGEWSAAFVTGRSTVVDSTGQPWRPATGVSGGVERTTTATVHGTGSPALYTSTRVGIHSWTVQLPHRGLYAVDLLMADNSDAAPGSRVFAVNATSGDDVTSLASRVDVARAVGRRTAFHVTGVFRAALPTVTLHFTASTGRPIAAALRITALRRSRTGVLDFQDTFNGPSGSTPNNRFWTHTVGRGWDPGVENYTDSRRNTSLNGRGDLVITARRSADGITSGRLTSQRKVTFGYGTVSARMRLPNGRATWPAFWSMGSDQPKVGWPTCGEIDIMEHIGRQPRVVSAHVHTLGSRRDADPEYGRTGRYISSLGRDWHSGAPVTGWHTYSISYEPDQITFRYDGRPYFVATPEDLMPGQSWPFNRAKNYLRVDLAVGGWAGNPDKGTHYPARLLVSRIWTTS
jgi:beta-glucanase (GH16 family)